MSEQPDSPQPEQVTVAPEAVTGTPVEQPDPGGEPAAGDEAGASEELASEQYGQPTVQSPEGASVAEQQAGGVPVQQPDPADQAHEMPQPPAEGGQPGGLGGNAGAGSEEPPAVVETATSNESVQLAPTPANGVAKAVAVLDHVIAVATAARAELDRLVPAEVRQQAADEVSRAIAAL